MTLSFAMYTYDYYGNGAVGGTDLNYLDNPNQHVQVNILTAGAGAFATGSSSVVENLYNGEQSTQYGNGGTNPPAWQTYTFNLTGVALAGTTYQLRFAEVNNQFPLSMGVNAVSINVVVPEPSSLLMVALGGVAIALQLRRRGAME